MQMNLYINFFVSSCSWSGRAHVLCYELNEDKWEKYYCSGDLIIPLSISNKYVRITWIKVSLNGIHRRLLQNDICEIQVMIDDKPLTNRFPSEGYYHIHWREAPEHFSHRSKLLKMFTIAVLNGYEKPDGWNLMPDGEFNIWFSHDFIEKIAEAFGCITSKTEVESYSIPFLSNGLVYLKFLLWSNSWADIIVKHLNVTIEYELVSPRFIKKNAISDLNSIITSKKECQKIIEEVISLIEKSLHKELWIDQWHLTSKIETGITVFNIEEKAIIKLQTAKEIDPNIADKVKTITSKIIDADIKLTEKIIENAKDIINPHYKCNNLSKTMLNNAERKLKEARIFVDMDMPIQAINHFKLAWSHAQNAIQHARYF